ncbi:MAG: MFS transporter [Pseudomonadota bacterium]
MNTEASDLERLSARYGAAYRWLATLTVMTGTISTVLSSTIVNVAIPDIMGAFGISATQAQWMSTGFLAAMTSTMLANAWMVGRFGQRGAFLLAIGVFTAGSILGGISPNEQTLIFARILQGGAAGLTQPLAMLVIFSVFPPEKRGQAMGIYGIGVVLAPALGPTIGGLLVDNLSWRYVFFMTLPFCLIGMGLATLLLPGVDARAAQPRLDTVGLFLIVATLFPLLTALANGQRWGWNEIPTGLTLLFSTACLLGLIAWERRHPHPLLDFNLFRNTRFSAAAAVTVIYGAGLFGSTYLIPVFVQTIQGYTPTRSGLLLMPAGLVLAVIFPVAGQLSDRLQPHHPVIVGLGVFALSFWLLHDVDTNTPFAFLAFAIALGRVGLGLVMPALTAGALRAVPPAKIAQGSGTVNFLRQLGGALGVNLLTVFMERRTAFMVDAMTATQVAGNAATQALTDRLSELSQAGGAPGDLAQGYAADFLGRVIYAQANTWAYREGFILVALVFLVAIAPAWLMGRSREVSHVSPDPARV